MVRIVCWVGCEFVRGNVHSFDCRAIVENGDEGAFEVHTFVAEGFYFWSREHDAGLDFVEYLVVVEGLFVFGN